MAWLWTRNDVIAAASAVASTPAPPNCWARVLLCPSLGRWGQQVVPFPACQLGLPWWSEGELRGSPITERPAPAAGAVQRSSAAACCCWLHTKWRQTPAGGPGNVVRWLRSRSQRNARQNATQPVPGESCGRGAVGATPTFRNASVYARHIHCSQSDGRAACSRLRKKWIDTPQPRRRISGLQARG